ncbi:MAG: phosphoribosylamine--glycine ligase [Candidatus Omnitrophica bacterium]|nr:phosphoribosylamine--glycine ligase [Candidatus Omnitrophota bacterium]
MKVLIVGSGGREHALAWKIRQSPFLSKLYAAPGNAGIAEIAECVPLSMEDLDALVRFAKEKEIDLTVIGPESLLAAGVVDRFQAEGLKIFGPTKSAARLESSKIFAKEIMLRSGVPTAEFKVFDDAAQAKHHLIESEPPFVIKADGLASGKGVVVATSCEDGVQAITKFMEEKSLGEAGSRIIIEERLEGEELSVLVFTDGESMLPLASAQDHKRLLDLDRGPNTGGMGAYSPCPFLSNEDFYKALDKTVRPILHTLSKEKIIYRGVLYAGLILTRNGPYVLEYNARFGDPETQAVLPRLKSDLLPVLLEIAEGRFPVQPLEWDERYSLNVVMASAGYPGPYEKGVVISGTEAFREKSDLFGFHAGTARNDRGELVTSGGRVLSVTGLGDTLKHAQEKAYEAIYQIRFEGAHFRKDIGRRALESVRS